MRINIQPLLLILGLVSSFCAMQVPTDSNSQGLGVDFANWLEEGRLQINALKGTCSKVTTISPILVPHVAFEFVAITSTIKMISERYTHIYAPCWYIERIRLAKALLELANHAPFLHFLHIRGGRKFYTIGQNTLYLFGFIESQIKNKNIPVVPIQESEPYTASIAELAHEYSYYAAVLTALLRLKVYDECATLLPCECAKLKQQVQEIIALIHTPALNKTPFPGETCLAYSIAVDKAQQNWRSDFRLTQQQITRLTEVNSVTLERIQQYLTRSAKPSPTRIHNAGTLLKATSIVQAIELFMAAEVSLAENDLDGIDVPALSIVIPRKDVAYISYALIAPVVRDKDPQTDFVKTRVKLKKLDRPYLAIANLLSKFNYTDFIYRYRHCATIYEHAEVLIEKLEHERAYNTDWKQKSYIEYISSQYQQPITIQLPLCRNNK